MDNTKKELKIFSITQYKQEEKYLSDMHRQGWKLTKVAFPGLYHFEACKPENVTYKLDYNQDGINNKPEYVQMFADCGWEYIFDFVGYSYFRKASESNAADENATDENATDEDIFCDDESRLDMLKRVYKGRMIPLVVIFFLIIIPQLLVNVYAPNGGSYSILIAKDIVAAMLLFCGFLYLIIFTKFTMDYQKYEKSMHPDDSKINIKYAGIFAGLILCAVVFVGSGYFKFGSRYQIHDDANGFVLDADNLNKKVVKEYHLKQGDNIVVKHSAEGGNWYIEIGEPGKEPVFYGNTFAQFDNFTVEIKNDGIIQIICRGRGANGTLEFEIQ